MNYFKVFIHVLAQIVGQGAVLTLIPNEYQYLGVVVVAILGVLVALVDDPTQPSKEEWSTILVNALNGVEQALQNSTATVAAMHEKLTAFTKEYQISNDDTQATTTSTPAAPQSTTTSLPQVGNEQPTIPPQV